MTNSSEQSPITPPVGGLEKGGKKTKKSTELTSTPIERVDPKLEKAERVAKETLWQRIVGEDNKEIESEPIKLEEPKPEAEGEINLSEEQTKEIALEHVEDRQEVVSDELMQSTPGTAESIAAAADAVLLERDQTHLGSDAESFHEALQIASQEAERAITQPLAAQEQAPEVPVKSTSELPIESYQLPPKPEMMPPVFMPYEEARLAASITPAEAAPTKAPLARSNETQPTPIREASNENPDGAVGGLFAGTVFGNFLGRRSGRKQAERRFRPFQRKEEREIREIKSEVTAQETQIRDLATKQYAERMTERPEKVPETVQKTFETPRPITQEAPTPALRVEAVPNQTTIERPAPRPIQPEVLPSLSHGPETLSDPETLLWAEKIIIDGASVRSVYEAKRISENGLKHVVNEYLRGGNVRKVLAQEMLEKELSYERDPILRDHFAGISISGSASSSFGKATVGDQNTPVFEPDTKPAAKQPLQAKLSDLASSPQNLAMAAWVTFIIVLACVAAILLLTK